MYLQCTVSTLQCSCLADTSASVPGWPRPRHHLRCPQSKAEANHGEARGGQGDARGAPGGPHKPKAKEKAGAVGPMVIMVMAVIITVLLLMLVLCCDCRKPKLSRMIRKKRI